MPLAPLEEIRSRVGGDIGTSGWFSIDQERIHAFAEATEDRQFIHTDPHAASAAGLGGTIAHGFLTLSLLSRMGAEAMLMPEGMAMVFNYGFDRVRFLAPVQAGKRVRARFRLESIDEKRPGQYLFRHDVTVEIKDEDKPALTATWLALVVTQGD